MPKKERDSTESEESTDVKKKGVIEFSEHLEKFSVAPIIGVFLTQKRFRTPLTFELFLKRTGTVPEVIIFLNVKKRRAPIVEDSARFSVGTIVPKKVFYVTFNVGFSETIGKLVIPSFIVSGTQIGLPQIADLDKITLFVPADIIRPVNKFIPLKTLFLMYKAMKSLFFGGLTVKFPQNQTVYLSDVASL